MKFKQKSIFSILLLLCCIFISLLLSNVPFIIRYFRKNKRFEGMEKMNFEDLDTTEQLDELQSSIDDVFTNVEKMDNLIKNNSSDNLRNTRGNSEESNDSFNTMIKKNINLLKTSIDNIDITDINSDLTNIMTKSTPLVGNNIASDYKELVNNLKNEIDNINKKITNKRQNLANQAVSDTNNSIANSKDMGNSVSSKNPLNKD